jgi:outer membrane protein assembly factor BamB
MSCQSKQDAEILIKEESEVTQTSSQPEETFKSLNSSQPEEVSSGLNSSSPNQNYNIEIIENLEKYGFGYWNRTLYGKEITYLGQYTTLSGSDQIYIQSKERVGLGEQDDEVSNRDTFSAQLIALTVQSDFSKWNQESPCKESWSFTIPYTPIRDIAFDEKNIYIGTTFGPGRYLGKDTSNIFCLDQETGQEVWRQPLKGWVISNLICKDKHLYFMIAGYKIHNLCIIDTQTGTMQEEIITEQAGVESSFYNKYTLFCFGDFLYYLVSVDNPLSYISKIQMLYAFSLKNHQETCLWKSEPSVHLFGTTNLVQVDSYLYMGLCSSKTKEQEQSILQIIAFNLKTQEIEWNYTDKDSNGFYGTYSTLCYYGNSLYINDTNTIIVFDLKTRTQKLTIHIDDYIITRLVPFKNTLYVVIAQEEMSLGRNYVSYNHQVLTIDPKDGSLLAKSLESQLNGIADIVGVYRDYLITQGPNKAFLEFAHGNGDVMVDFNNR